METRPSAPVLGHRHEPQFLAPGADLDLPSLRTWAKRHLAPYKVPTLLRIVDELPRNAMGKVMKPPLMRAFTA